ncbi:MAG TPA: flagellar basal body rod protein FlgB, partial [Caldilineae bacterium]|nr:flagellar basal body rod protein FlgB [Caldilineae bacterium]
ILDKVLAIRARRNGVISANIANVDTPGYKAKNLPFERALAMYLGEKGDGLSLERTNPHHLQRKGWEKIASPEDLVVESGERGTPNNVDIDVEMARLAENNLQYQTALQVLIRRLEGLKTAITEGGRP